MQSVMAKELPVFDSAGAPKRALMPLFVLFFAVLLSTVPFNAQPFTPKFVSLGSLSEQLIGSLVIAIGVDNVWVVAVDNNRIERYLSGYPDTIDRPATSSSATVDDQSMLANVTETYDDQSNLASVVWARAKYILNGSFQLTAFTCLQLVDQICSYRFTLY